MHFHSGRVTPFRLPEGACGLLPTPFERSKLGLEVVRKQLILDLNNYITDKCFVRVCIRILAVDLKFDTLDGIAEEINVVVKLAMVIFLIVLISEYISTL